MYRVMDETRKRPLFFEEFANHESALEFALHNLPETVEFEVVGEQQDLGLATVNTLLPEIGTEANVVSLCAYRLNRGA